MTLPLVDNFSQQGINACYIYSNSLKDNPDLAKDIAWGVYQIVYNALEMKLPNNNAMWQVLHDVNSAFRHILEVLVMDETHSVYACGAPGKDGIPPFQKEYANIGCLQAVFSPSVLFLVMLATLP